MRTKKSFINALSVLGFNLIIGIIGFIKVRVFVNGLSNDIYSLNQLFYQVFSYIAITDIGFGLLLNKALYQAFAENNQEKVNDIYSTSRKFYNIIALIMLSISLIISFFIHYFTKAQVSTLYIQVMFIIFVLKNVVDYFFIAPRYVLEADQKLYKVNHYVRLIKIIEQLVEMVLVILGVDFLLVLIPGIFITIIMDIFINKKIYNYYPWLKNTKNFNKNYLKGTKEVIWQKLAGLLGSNTDIILISTFINPLTVIIYTSYTYITKFITDTIYMLFTAILPSFANVLLKENSHKTYEVFNEVNIFFLYLASFIFIMLYGFLNSLIFFWVGKTYLVKSSILFCFTFIAFELIADKSLMLVINSKGLFKETKVATILEAILNLVISLFLVNKIGLIGVLLGTIISKLLTSFIQNPIYIYKNILVKNPLSYYLKYFGALALSLIFIILFNIISLNITSIKAFILYVLIFAFLVGIILFGLYYLFFKSFRNLTKRGIEFIKVRGKYLEEEV